MAANVDRVGPVGQFWNVQFWHVLMTRRLLRRWDRLREAKPTKQHERVRNAQGDGQGNPSKTLRKAGTSYCVEFLGGAALQRCEQGL
jgi:hypothetical protein